MEQILLEKAIRIAVEAHRGQLDKNGEPYLLHVLRVMERGKTLREKICGALHDVVEDNAGWTFDRLRGEGYDEEMIHALDCLTKREGEAYDEFVQRTKASPLAIRVKLNDLEDNMDVRRLKTVGEEEALRLNKYLKAYRELIR